MWTSIRNLRAKIKMLNRIKLKKGLYTLFIFSMAEGLSTCLLFRLLQKLSGLFAKSSFLGEASGRLLEQCGCRKVLIRFSEQFVGQKLLTDPFMNVNKSFSKALQAASGGPISTKLFAS